MQRPTFLFFFLLTSLAACGDDLADSDHDAGDVPGRDAGRDSGSSVDASAQEDAGLRDASPDAQTTPDGDAAPDAPDAPDAAAESDGGVGPTGLVDYSCDTQPPTRSPDGRVIAYNDCNQQLVMRNVVTGAVTVVPRLGFERDAREAGLLFSDGSRSSAWALDWDGTVTATFAYSGPLARVQRAGTEWWSGVREKVQVGAAVETFFRFSRSTSAAASETAHAIVTDHPQLDTIVSSDGTQIAAFERPAEGPPRLTRAPLVAGSDSVSTQLSGVLDPRWLPDPSATFGTSALFVAARQLHEANLATGTTRQLSSHPVIASLTAAGLAPAASLAHVVARGSMVYWAESTRLQFRVLSWNRATPDVPAAVIASGVDVNGSAALPHVDGYPTGRGLQLTPDGRHLLVYVEEQISSSHWKSIDLASGAITELEHGFFFLQLGGAARTAFGSSSPVFRDLNTGEQRILPLESVSQYALVSPDGTLTVVRREGDYLAPSMRVNRLDFADGSTTLLDLPSSAENGKLGLPGLIPVAGGTVIWLVDDVNASPSVHPKHRIYVAR